MGCTPNGCPSICQMTATMSPLHIEAIPAACVTLFQNMPKTTGASSADTDIAVPVTIRFTNPGMANASTSAIADTINTDNLLYNNIFVLSGSFTFGLMMSLTIDRKST